MTLATSHRHWRRRSVAAVVIAAGIVLVAPLALRGDEPAGGPTGGPGGATAEPPIAGTWAADPVWDDGNAEVATYTATQTIYGKERRHTATLITVKEDFTEAHQVKADWPYGDKPVRTMLKTNLVEDIPTENYPYRSLTSVFVARDEPLRGYKVSYGLHEWCGNTYKELRQYDQPEGARLVYHTYWDGQGSGEAPLDEAMMAAVPEEQLFLFVRALELGTDRNAQFLLLTSLRGSQFHGLRANPATLTIAPQEEIATIGARRVGTCLVTIEPQGAPPMRFVVAGNPARTLVSADLGDGRTYALESVERRQYWVR